MSDDIEGPAPAGWLMKLMMNDAPANETPSAKLKRIADGNIRLGEVGRKQLALLPWVTDLEQRLVGEMNNLVEVRVDETHAAASLWLRVFAPQLRLVAYPEPLDDLKPRFDAALALLKARDEIDCYLQENDLKSSKVWTKNDRVNVSLAEPLELQLWPGGDAEPVDLGTEHPVAKAMEVLPKLLEARRFEAMYKRELERLAGDLFRVRFYLWFSYAKGIWITRAGESHAEPVAKFGLEPMGMVALQGWVADTVKELTPPRPTLWQRITGQAA